MSKNRFVSEKIVSSCLTGLMFLPVVVLFSLPYFAVQGLFNTARSTGQVLSMFKLSGRQAMQRDISRAVSDRCGRALTRTFPAEIGETNRSYAVTYQTPKGLPDEGESVELRVGAFSAGKLPLGLEVVPASSGVSKKEALQEISQVCGSITQTANKLVYFSPYPDAVFMTEAYGRTYVTPIGRTETIDELLTNAGYNIYKVPAKASSRTITPSIK